jgi:L-alanine-DL-glutamate epimerase-like enolase superfamily enzyme
MDPRQFGRISESLLATTRLSAGGLAHQAVAAIENACLDIAGKAAGLPVHTLLGGPLRDRVPVYWTHCGSFRVGPRKRFYTEVLGCPPIHTLHDLADVARQAVAQGYRAVKTNPVFFDGAEPVFFSGGFRIAPGFLDRSPSDRHVGAIVEQMTAFREAVGPDVGLMLDLSFSQRTEGYLRIAQRLEHLNLSWLELDTPDPQALSLIRRHARVPIASLESLHGIGQYRPFVEQQTVDTCIVDPMWNGVWQSARIAHFADAYETTMAPHNPVGALGSLMSLHLSAAVPNLRIMELRVDEAPWTRDFLTHPPEVVDGSMLVLDRPGWGSDLDEDALRAHPPRGR